LVQGRRTGPGGFIVREINEGLKKAGGDKVAVSSEGGFNPGKITSRVIVISINNSVESIKTWVFYAWIFSASVLSQR